MKKEMSCTTRLGDLFDIWIPYGYGLQPQIAIFQGHLFKMCPMQINRGIISHHREVNQIHITTKYTYLSAEHGEIILERGGD